MSKHIIGSVIETKGPRPKAQGRGGGGGIRSGGSSDDVCVQELDR